MCKTERTINVRFADCSVHSQQMNPTLASCFPGSPNGTMIMIHDLDSPTTPANVMAVIKHRRDRKGFGHTGMGRANSTEVGHSLPRQEDLGFGTSGTAPSSTGERSYGRGRKPGVCVGRELEPKEINRKTKQKRHERPMRQGKGSTLNAEG